MLYKNYEINIDKNKLQTSTNPYSWIASILRDYIDLSWYRVDIRVGGSSPKEVFETAKLEIELREIHYLKSRLDRSVHKILKLDKRNNYNAT